MGRSKCSTVSAEDVGDLERGSLGLHPRHPPGLAPLLVRPSIWPMILSSELVTVRTVLSATPRVKRGVVELGVAEQDLDDADVGAVLEQMRGEAVPQRWGLTFLVSRRSARP